MHEGTQVGDPNRVLNDYKTIDNNINGTYKDAADKINAGQITKFLGGTMANPLGGAKAEDFKGTSLEGFVAREEKPDTGNPFSAFSGMNKPKTKAEMARARLQSSYDPLMGDKSYSQKKNDAKKIRMMDAGKLKDKDPMAGGGGTGVDFLGNANPTRKACYVTKEMVRDHANLLQLTDVRDNENQMVQNLQHRTAFEAVEGVKHGDQEMTDVLRTKSYEDIKENLGEMGQETKKLVHKILKPIPPPAPSFPRLPGEKSGKEDWDTN
jgi:hypothetical protein